MFTKAHHSEKFCQNCEHLTAHIEHKRRKLFRFFMLLLTGGLWYLMIMIQKKTVAQCTVCGENYAPYKEDSQMPEKRRQVAKAAREKKKMKIFDDDNVQEW